MPYLVTLFFFLILLVAAENYEGRLRARLAFNKDSKDPIEAKLANASDAILRMIGVSVTMFLVVAMIIVCLLWHQSTI